jgi:hypothetical protein
VGQFKKREWLVQLRQAKGERSKKAFVCLHDRLTFDLEELATVARQVRLLKAHSARRLTAHPAESEQPGVEINHFKNKVA